MLLSRTATCAGLCSLLAACILLLLGQASTSFFIQYDLAGLFHPSGSVFEYSLWGGLQRLYHAKLYRTYYLVAFWSGLFPFIKLILLVLLYLDVNIYQSFHKHVLAWLTRLSAWSFVDIWFVCLTSIFVNFHEHVYIKVFYRDREEVVHVSSFPSSGVVFLTVGLLFSQAACIITMLCLQHGRVEDISLLQCLARHGHCDGAGRISEMCRRYDSIWFTMVTNFGIACLLLFFVWSAFFLPIIEVKYDVLSYHVFYESFTLFRALKQMQLSSNILLKYFLTPLFMTLVLLFPCFQQFTAMLLWFIPLPDSVMSWLTRFLEVAPQYSSLEVFLVTAIVASHEIGELVTHLEVGRYVHITPAILPGMYYLLSCLCLLAIWKYFLFRSLSKSQGIDKPIKHFQHYQLLDNVNESTQQKSEYSYSL